MPFYVCPGISTWRTVTGRTSNAMANLLSAAENGVKHGAIGFLNTDWGDHGHTQPLAVCYPGYTYGAAVSWAVAANRNLDVPAVLDRHVFRDRAGVTGRLVCDLGDAYKVPGVEIRNASVLFHILTKPEENFNKGPCGKLTGNASGKRRTTSTARWRRWGSPPWRFAMRGSSRTSSPAPPIFLGTPAVSGSPGSKRRKRGSSGSRPPGAPNWPPN